jgi:hypothetical protein
MAEQGNLDFEPQHDHLKVGVERALASAKRLENLNDPGAKGAFDEAESLAIKSADPDIQMRVFESSARFHEKSGALSSAKKRYITALRNAFTVNSDSAVDREAVLRWDLVRIDNREDSAFKNLVRASRHDDSPDRLRSVWEQFVTDRTNVGGRKAARGFGTTDYFRGRIDTKKLDPGN